MHIKSKGLDGGFFNGLASYMVEPNIFLKRFFRDIFSTRNKCVINKVAPYPKAGSTYELVLN